jgi:hypothetical protein
MERTKTIREPNAREFINGDVVAKPRGDYWSTPVEAPLGRDSG